MASSPKEKEKEEYSIAMSDASEAGEEMRNDAEENDEDDKELAAMKARVAEMEAEAAKLRELQAQAEKQNAEENGNDEDKAAVDARSIYIGNVDYGATPEEIQAHFAPAGTINRVTILCDKYTSHPKGYAYVEFAEPSLVAHALHLNESLFRGRLITVVQKRTNLPGMGTKRGRGRGGYRGGYHQPRGYSPYARGRGRGRGRGY